MTSLLVMVVLGAWSAGWYRRWCRAARRREADRVRSLERARIAREMHDVLGHDLTLIALSAGALKLAPGLAEQHRAAAAELRTRAGTAVRHLGEVVGALRNDAGPPALGGEAPPRSRSGSGRSMSVRWTLAAAVVIPFAGGAAVAGLQYSAVAQTVLRPDRYARLELGQPRAALQLPDRRLDRSAGEPGCEYYAITAQPLADRSGDAYRLCFADGVLVSFAPMVAGR